MTSEHLSRIGVVGTGFLARHFVLALEMYRDLAASKVLTRTNIWKRTDFPRQDLLTNSVEELLDNSDLVVECSGDAVYATEVIAKTMKASLPVVTMDSELQVTTGSYFARRGFITEAEGDQSGSLASLRENAIQMGFKPLVYGNIKRFLNHSPTKGEMEFWAAKQNYSLEMTTSFTDGTKLQIEQALVANGLGTGIAQPGLLGIASEDVESGAQILAEESKKLGYPISDYVLSSKAPAGVFIVAEHDQQHKMSLSNYKMGEGPYYLFLRPYHICHFETPYAIRRAVKNRDPILVQKKRVLEVGSRAKKDLKPGTKLDGIGGFHLYGVLETPSSLPIGLSEGTILRKSKKRDEPITWDDVEFEEDDLGLKLWKEQSD